MKKIVCFSASPRKKSTTSLLNQAIKGIEDANGEAIVYDLNNPTIRGCQGCFYCRTHDTCSLKNDYLYPMYEDIKNCEGILFTSPIYFFDISGQAKVLLDRLYPMITDDFKARFPNKKIASIYSQGSFDPHEYQDVIDKMNDNFTMFGWNILNTIVSTGTMEDGFVIDSRLMDQAFEIGRDLVLK